MNYDTCRSLNLARGCGWQEKKSADILFSFSLLSFVYFKKSTNILFLFYHLFRPPSLVAPKLHGFNNFKVSLQRFVQCCSHMKNWGRWSRRICCTWLRWISSWISDQFETVFAEARCIQSGFWIWPPAARVAQRQSLPICWTKKST